MPLEPKHNNLKQNGTCLISTQKLSIKKEKISKYIKTVFNKKVNHIITLV